MKASPGESASPRSFLGSGDVGRLQLESALETDLDDPRTAYYVSFVFHSVRAQPQC